MLVRDIINAIHNKEMTVPEIATKYGVSDRTIQNKIKKLGFTWNHKEMKYIANEEVTEETYNTPFNDLMQVQRINTPKQVKAVTEDSKRSQTVQKKQTATKKADTEGYDTLDYLLFGEQLKNEGRQYKGYYMDADVLSIIDNVKSGSKSDLVNEALRKIFKEKGLL